MWLSGIFQANGSLRPIKWSCDLVFGDPFLWHILSIFTWIRKTQTYTWLNRYSTCPVVLLLPALNLLVRKSLNTVSLQGVFTNISYHYTIIQNSNYKMIISSNTLMYNMILVLPSIRMPYYRNQQKLFYIIFAIKLSSILF